LPEESDRLKPSLEIAHHHAAEHKAPRCCPNCQASARDHFCSLCGETLTVHSPTAGEFIHEFIGHYVALEGRLWRTLRLLMTRPGQLTVDFLRGRRVPYIDPLRLYLTLSLVMFGLIKLYGVDLPRVTFDDRSFGATYSHAMPGLARDDGTFPVAALSIKGKSDSGTHTVGQALMTLGSVDPTWAKNAQRFMAAAPEEQADIVNHGFLANLPYMLIGALPLFACYLKLIWWRSRRHYGDHLVFALHTTTFAFLLASVMIVIPGNLGWLIACAAQGNFALISAWDIVQLLPVAWVLAYVPAAMHTVYGGGRAAAVGRSLVLMTVHVMVICGLVVGAEIIAILRHG